MDREFLRRLYRHARGEDDRRQLFEKDPKFVKGWVNLESPAAVEIISAFVPLDDADTLKHARRLAQNNLEAQPWNDLLGINSPKIKCVVMIHGSKWGLRFQSAEPGLRGREILNESLPAIPADEPSDQVNGAASAADEAPASRPEPPMERPAAAPNVRQDSQLAAAEAALRKGGLPA
jgi:hypothetical protein